MARNNSTDGLFPNTRRPAPGMNPNSRAQAIAAQRARINNFGSAANPYANSTNTNPYVGIAWLGSGFPHALPTVPANVSPPEEFGNLQYGASRASYDLAGIAALLGPYWHIPIRVDYNLLMKIREAIPMISAAIIRMRELVGTPDIEASKTLKPVIDEWARRVPVNRMQFGLKNFMQTHLDNMFTYGRAHSEVILNNTRNDIFGLVEVHPTTAGLRPTFGNYAVNVVQYQYGGGVPVTLIPELLLSSVNDIRGDDPNGTSLIGELPFVAKIANTMLNSTSLLWDRFGTPTYHLNWEPPETWEDPQGPQTAAILQRMGAGLRESIRLRGQGQVTEFTTSGKTTIDVVGAAGEQLSFREDFQTIAEQIAARIGLPPFMYGFSWSTTERMSTAQAKMVTEIIEAAREVVQPQLEKLIALWQMVTGRGGKVGLHWPKVSLQDLIDQARARAMEAQAETAELSNWSIKVTAGINSMEEMAQQFRDDLDGLSAEQVRKQLPDLATEPPIVAVAPAGAGGGDVPPGEGTGGNNPRDESVSRGLALTGNGNGKH